MSETNEKTWGTGVSRRTWLKGVASGAAATAVSPLLAQNEVRPVYDFSRGMYVVITGSGSAMVDPFRGNASTAVIVDGTILQFDCGRKTMDNQMLAGINPVDVDYILFTHLHFDHIATYDYYIISSWIAGRSSPFQVFGPVGTEAMSKGAFEKMHTLDVRFVEDLVQNWVSNTPEKPLPHLPLTVKDIEPGTVLETDKFKVTCKYTAHLAAFQMRSLGYRIESPYGTVAISGDTAPCQAMVELGKGVDILVHECVVPDAGMVKDGKFTLRKGVRRLETDTENPGTGHTSPSELGRLAQQAGAKMLVPTHLPPYSSVPAAIEMSRIYYGSRPEPGIWGEWIAAIKKGFSGRVVLAEDAKIFKL